MTKQILLFCLATGAFCQTELTVYNRNFALIKERRVLELKPGANEVRVSELTAHLEPDSVVLRDLKRPGSIRILEQNYESDPLSEALLLRKCEGKVLDFEVVLPTGEKKIVKGRVLRSGYVPHVTAFNRYGQQYYRTQMALANQQSGGQPIVEVDKRIQFGLPGRPIFDAIDPGAFLKPTLLWRLWADEAGRHETELSYLTGGMRWEATYNAVAQGKGDVFDLTGWVTLENMSGQDFENARLKLVAGDVARAGEAEAVGASMRAEASKDREAAVTERAFDEYHLYVLPRPVTVLDREVKQVEFVRASRVPATRIYVYDGVKIDARYRGWDYHNIRTQAEYGTVSNPKVWAMLEFQNSVKSNLGMPLPRGKVKIYRRDVDGHDEFAGEDQIDHTPQDETLRLYTGNAFDLAGERRQTNFKLDAGRRSVDETFEIRVRNHKHEAVEVRVVEHLYRGVDWAITAKSMEFNKSDARTIEFRPRIPAGAEAVITYTVHYTW